MLAGKGFKEVYNLSGGIKAWDGQVAFGPQDQGIELFSGDESPEAMLIVAYSLEEGLRDFYLSIIPGTKEEKARQLYGKLADEDVFRQVSIDPEVHTLVWPNGADFDPETLHDWHANRDALSAMVRRHGQPSASVAEPEQTYGEEDDG